MGWIVTTKTMSIRATRSALLARRSKLTRKWLSRVVIWAVLLTGSVVMLFPLLWMISSSFKLEQKVFVFPPELIPNPFCPQNYVEA